MFLDKDQLEAVNLCVDMNRRLVGITGGAGTGKTTIIKEIYERLLGTKSIAICAPTGKAAKRITEATGIEATTIHRLLEYPMPEDDQCLFDGPRRNRQNRLDYDVIICDEYSMVSFELNDSLMAAIPNGGVLRVFGDSNQLNPIETLSFGTKGSSPFKDILKNFPNVNLTTIHRQGEGSSIITNGARILSGRMPISDDSFKILNTSTHSAIEIIENILSDKESAEEYYGIGRQFIVPSNKGWVGTRKLNQRVQSIRYGLFNELPFKEIERKRTEDDPTIKIFKGDKIIFTKNDYNIEVFNGESGIVDGFDKRGGIIIDFGDRKTVIPEAASFFKSRREIIYNPQQFIDLGYVITTHKSQGSEYEEVCYILDKSQRFMQGKHNFYTAITRAKKRIIIISDIKSISASLQEEISK